MKTLPALLALSLSAVTLTGCAPVDADTLEASSTPTFSKTSEIKWQNWFDPTTCVTSFDAAQAEQTVPREVTLDCGVTSTTFEVDLQQPGEKANSVEANNQQVYQTLPGGPGDWHIEDFHTTLQNGDRAYVLGFTNTPDGIDSTGEPTGQTYCFALNVAGDPQTVITCTGEIEDGMKRATNTVDDTGKITSIPHGPQEALMDAFGPTGQAGS